MSENTLNIGDMVEYVYYDGKKDLSIGIVVNVETNDDYENQYSVLWLDDDEEGDTVCNGYARSQLVKVTQ